jgi:CCR4-NOT transcription complex subunit 1
MRNQIGLLRWLVQSPRDVFDLNALTLRKILTAEHLIAVPPATRSVAMTWLASPWNSLDLLETLLILADAETGDDAKQLLDLASRQSTELITLGLCMIKVRL